MSGASSQPVSPSDLLPISGERRSLPNWKERWTAPLRVLPNLLVIGAQKCGTSSLHEYLRVQREVRMSRIKECNVLWTPAWSLREYRAYFPSRATCLLGGVKRVGESSPFYLFHPAAIEGARRLDAATRDLRAIAVLRDPVGRAWSHYKHSQRWHGESVPFEQALDMEEERIAASEADFRSYSYQARGDYALQLARWFDLLGRDRVLVLEFTEVLAMRAEMRAEIARFLGLSGPLEGEFGGFNLGRREELPAGVRARLEERFREPNERLAELLGRRFTWMR
ncbi:MAG: sulfotransferase domain-containing protein [Planctomycetaceae bacterium]|nr:sulfotransferase domain-containing protein [Planctomycetaceae bacterium]